MATTSQIRQLQTPDNLVDVYPLTLEEAVFDDNGVQLSTKIHNLENRPLWNPKGTCTFANLPALSTAQTGDMWNISDQFTTTSDFHEGAGILVPAGSNVYKTADGKWDILTGSAVVGVKGNAEQNYRAGNVNITLQNLGYDVENDLLATAPGYVLDARQGRVISGSILSISGRVDDIEAELSGGGSVCFLGTCNTGASTASKAVTVSDPNYTLKTGTEIVVQYTYTNTAQNPTISVNGGAAKSIYYGSQVVTTDKLDIAGGTAGEYVRYVYDGTYWVWIGHGKDIDAGHTILGSAGESMPQRDKLQFMGLDVTDDNANDTTTVSAEKIQHQLTDQTNVLGAKNLLPMTVANLKAANTAGTWSGNEYTISGLTFKLDTDSNDNVIGIVVNGELSNDYSDTYLRFSILTGVAKNDVLANGNYILNGCPSGGATGSKYHLRMQKIISSTYSTLARDIGSGSDSFAIDDSFDNINCQIIIFKNYTATNLTFYPMIRLASDPDDTYVTYAMTNRELTEKITNEIRLVKVTQAQYEALSATQKNDPNTTWMITDTEAAQGISASITISTTGWSSTTTTVDGTAYYTHETSLSSVFDSHPDIQLGALGTVPTSAEKTAFGNVYYIRVDTSTNKLICYATAKPGANFVIVVKGVSV